MKLREKIEKTGNVYLKHTLIDLRKAAKENNAKIWKRVADDLSRPARQSRRVNLSRISRYASENDTVVVPGKVLGVGELKKSIKVAAFSFSESSIKKINNSKSIILSFKDLIKKNPKGTKIKIIG